MISDVSLSHFYKKAPDTIFSFIAEGALFKLTGADEINFVFREGGKFKLVFHNRGLIEGIITHLTNSQVWMKWNVTGFEREPEETEVHISVLSRGKTELSLEHRGIVSKESAAAKKKAWSEILDGLERIR